MEENKIQEPVTNEVNDFFAELTERKTPAPKAEPTPASAWGDDFVKPVEIKETPATPAQPAPVKTISQTTAEQSASVAIGTTNVIQASILRIVTRKKFEKKFTQDEVETLDRIKDLPPDKLQPEEISLRNRFYAAVAKFEKQWEAIDFTDKERNEMKFILAEYFKATGKELSPGYLLVGAFVESLGKRVANVLFD